MQISKIQKKELSLPQDITTTTKNIKSENCANKRKILLAKGKEKQVEYICEKSELIRQELIAVLISRKKERFLVHVSEFSQRAERSRKESRKINSCSQNTNGK